MQSPGLKHRLLITLQTGSLETNPEISGVLCEPTYALTRRTVTDVTGPSRGEDRLRVSATAETLDLGTEPSNITNLLVNHLHYQLPTIGAQSDALFQKRWYSLLNFSEPRSNVSDWTETNLTAEVSQRVWTAFAALAVGVERMSGPHNTLHGIAVFSKTRLYIQKLSLRLTEALLALLTLFSIALYFLSPGIFCQDPGSIGSHFFNFSKQPDSQGFFEGRRSRLQRNTEVLPPRVHGFCSSWEKIQ